MGEARPPLGRTIMVQGTASHVGKSWLAAGLCRLLAQDGWRVRPFKAQNMSNNAAVTADGGEIGRSQALQAEAAGVAPHTDMNPILLKPCGSMTSQVVLQGRPAGLLRFGASGTADPALRARAWAAVGPSLGRLRATADVVVIEGAGSPAELNLRDGDMANMAVAALADAPVLLVGDIDRGGIFAALLGTLALLRPDERARVAALVVNRFRGDPSLFAEGRRILEERGGCPVLGVVPWLDLDLPEEDAAVLDAAAPAADPGTELEVVVVRLPCISNFTDFAPLAAVPGLHLRYAAAPEAAAGAAAVIVPGSKNALADLGWLRATGWEPALAAAPLVLGICGGMQMLGRALRDPLGVEGGEPRREAAGLGLLDVDTEYGPGKRTVPVEASVAAGAPGWMPRVALHGFEIRAGTSRTAGDWLEPPGLAASSPDGRVLGCYLHGLFDGRAFRAAFVDQLRRRRGWPSLPAEAFADAAQRRAEALDGLAAALRTHLDAAALRRIIGLPEPAGHSSGACDGV